MQVKKFEAPTIQEAIEAIKREMGPEAVILSTKRNKRGYGLLNGASFEVTAGISEKALQQREVKKAPAPVKVAAQAATLAQRNQSLRQQKYADITDDDFKLPSTMPIEQELQHLKRMMEELRSENRKPVVAEAPKAADITLPKTLEDSHAGSAVYEQLVMEGVDRRLAFQITKEAMFELDEHAQENTEAILDQVAAEILKRVKSERIFFKPIVEGPTLADGPKLVAVVGPTGVGKTTTLAKLAASASQLGLRLGMINLDQYRLGASEQFSTYARLLNIPYRSIYEPSDWKDTLVDFKGLDWVLIDTTGRSQKDADSLMATLQLLNSANRNIETHLVLSGSTRDAEAKDMIQQFSAFKPKSFIFTKLDEVRTYGWLLNWTQTSKLPISFFTTGQRVPEDVEAATPERVASLVLRMS